MKKNANVFIGLVLFAALCGGFVWLMGVNEEDQWQPSGVYDQLHTSSYTASSTSATLSSSASGSGLALRMSPSSTMRHSGASFYAGAYSGASYASLASSPLASSPMGGASGAGLHLTSTAEFKSIGGGGNGGASMGGGSMRATSSPNNLITSSPISLSPITYSVSQGSMGASADRADAMMADNPVAAMAASANGLAFSTFSGFSSAEATVGDYTAWGADAYTGMGRSAVRGRQNAMGFNDAWWKWFDTWATKHGSSYQDEDGSYWFSRSTLNEVYQQFLDDYWNSGMGDEPSFEEWLDWYQAAMNNENGYYAYGDNKYYWLPVGDILPLIFFALLYIAFMAFKSIKPSFKPERSE